MRCTIHPMASPELSLDVEECLVDAIARELGYCPYDEVVHRDNLAVIRRDQATS